MLLNDKGFRLLRKATKGFASGHHHLLKKVDENFFIFTLLQFQLLGDITSAQNGNSIIDDT